MNINDTISNFAGNTIFEFTEMVVGYRNMDNAYMSENFWMNGFTDIDSNIIVDEILKGTPYISTGIDWVYLCAELSKFRFPEIEATLRRRFYMSLANYTRELYFDIYGPNNNMYKRFVGLSDCTDIMTKPIEWKLDKMQLESKWFIWLLDESLLTNISFISDIDKDYKKYSSIFDMMVDPLYNRRM